MPEANKSDQKRHIFARHERSFESNRFVYPVVSRRSGGISIGINLNPDKVCNFDCIYCQVNRVETSQVRFVEIEALLAELEAMVRMVTSGELFECEKFCDIPPALRRLNDFAFSGDGEPTTYQNVDQIIEACAAVKQRHGLHDVKLVLITNASMFHRPPVSRGLRLLDENQGEIWAKLDAGTEAYYQLVDRTKIPFQRVLDNITQAAIERPLVIQALFMRINGEPPTPAEQQAFCDRLNEIVAAGGGLKLIQIYTVARTPAESYVAPLTNSQLDELTELVRARTGLKTAVFYGVAEIQASADHSSASTG